MITDEQIRELNAALRGYTEAKIALGWLPATAWRRQRARERCAEVIAAGARAAE